MSIIIGTSGVDSLGGTGAADEIYGLEGDDSLAGGDGDDRLDGGEGADAMAGGAGDDVYIVDDAADLVTEAAGEGMDEVRTTLGFYMLGDHVEKLTGLSSGGQGLYGNALDNVIAGGAGMDDISGNDGDDVIVHSAGGGWVSGDAGWDVYVLPGSASDYAITYDESGLKLVDLAEGAETWLIGIEAFTFVADGVTTSVDAMFNRYGTGAGDLLEGNDSDNLIYGYGGDDILVGFGGRDILDGGTGADTMSGGGGMDDYFVDDAGDVVIEDFDGSEDRVFVWLANYTLSAHVEWLTLMIDDDAILVGNNGWNMIAGGAGADRLEGLGGDDGLDGGAGADTMIGGSGNDTYQVDDVGDLVVEASGGGMDAVTANVASYVLPSNVENLFAYLGDQTLTGNALANRITIGPGAYAVNGGAGTDTVSWEWDWQAVLVDLATGEMGGGAADDGLVSIENLTGGYYEDVLRGNAAANVLDGAQGADLLVGRAGNDVYYVDDGGDQVIEAAGEGTDEVRVRWLAGYALPDNVERLKYIGEDPFAGTGNALNNDMTGGSGADTLHGGEGHDYLAGGAGDDAIHGEAGHDTLSGGLGGDLMAGGEGNDVYIVENGLDQVVELAGEGSDQVFASTPAYALPDHVEHLQFNGSGPFAGTGNGLGNSLYGGSGDDLLAGAGGDDVLNGQGGADVLSGGDGADRLSGGAGGDVLTGGAGADVFAFSNYESGTGGGADRIADFTAGEDVIDLSAWDADSGLAGNQAFAFVGTAAFSGTAGELRHYFDGADTWLQADTNGDGVADFEIVLTGAVTPLAGDFIL